MNRRTITLVITFTAAVLLLGSCAVNPVTGKKQLMLMTEAQEIQLGADYDPQVVATFGEYRDDRMLALINEKGKEMGLISHRPKLAYHFRILDTPVINAFAVPGGYIYLTRGILAHLNNEAEMLGVLGHEMGHITARHTAASQAKQQLGSLLLIGGMIASEEFRNYAEYAMQGMQLLFLSFSRDDEREADRLGVEYSSKIGYDAKKMADFYKVLVKMNMASDHAGVPTFMSTHPDPGDRYNSVLNDAGVWQEKLGLETYAVNANNYLQLIDGMIYGEDPRQGFVEGNIFYHPELKFRFSFPPAWQFENSPMQVTMAPEDGKAMMIFTLATANSLEEAAQKTIQELQLTLTDSRKTTINGMPALITLTSQVSQDQATGQQTVTRILSGYINYSGMYYVFHGVSYEADFPSYAQYFESVMGSFNTLTDPAKLNVQPMRVRVVTAKSATTLADLFRSYGVPQDRYEEYALLNNRELNSRIEAGTMIKITGR
ncbi:MAG: M48 family metalloprotease [Bacteroidales bacterium]|jgi:predicted Zn-dependent protease|nr:M48 family metalloprotease [Bacteroidales bacterium]